MSSFLHMIFSLVFVSIEKIYQTLKTELDQLSKHPEVRQKYSAARRVFDSLHRLSFLIYYISLNLYKHPC